MKFDKKPGTCKTCRWYNATLRKKGSEGACTRWEKPIVVHNSYSCDKYGSKHFEQLWANDPFFTDESVVIDSDR